MSIKSYVMEYLSQLTPEERLEVFEDYCKECGDYQPESICNCWRDE